MADSMKLGGKVAMVTGGGSSLGLAIARRLSEDGASVVIADIAGAEAAAEQLRSGGRQALGVTTDVADPNSVRSAFSQALDRFGTLDILVNNAALSSTLEGRPFERIDVSEWRRVLDVNVIGLALCCQAAAPVMRARKSGRIINLGSTVAFKGVPFLSHYVASKGAVMSLTRTLANELGGDGITVNAVAPGYLLTEGNMTNPEMIQHQRAAAIAGRALKRDGHAEDLVGAVSFLASDDAAFITGQILAVDGGSVYH